MIVAMENGLANDPDRPSGSDAVDGGAAQGVHADMRDLGLADMPAELILLLCALVVLAAAFFTLQTKRMQAEADEADEERAVREPVRRDSDRRLHRRD
jgi:hypothetical protein